MCEQASFKCIKCTNFPNLVCMHVNGSISECGCWEIRSFASLTVCFFAYGKRVHLILTCQYFTCYYFCMASYISKRWIFDSMLLSKEEFLMYRMNHTYLSNHNRNRTNEVCQQIKSDYFQILSYFHSDYATKIQAQYKFSSYLPSVVYKENRTSNEWNIHFIFQVCVIDG